MSRRIVIIITILLLSIVMSGMPAFAHGAATLTVSPVTAAAGETITVSLDGVVSGETFTITLVGLNVESELGTMTVGDGVDTVTQDFTLPSNVPADTYQVQATSADGDILSAELTIEAASSESGSTTAAEPSAEPMQLDRSKPAAQLVVIGLSIVVSAGLGLWLVVANERRQTR